MNRIRDEVRLKQHIDELEARQRDLSVLNEFAISLMGIFNVDDLFWHVAREVAAKLDFPDCVIYRHEIAKGHLVQVAASGPKNPGSTEITNPLTIPVGSGITGTVAETKLPIIVKDLTQDPRYIHDVMEARSEICVPILVDGEVYGVIDCEDQIAASFDNNHLEILTTVASLTSSKITQNTMMEKYVRQAEIIRQVSEIVIISDSDGTIIDCNPATEEVTQLSATNIIGLNIFDITARGYEANMLRPEITSLLANGESWSRRVPIIDTDDKTKYFDVSITPVSSPDGSDNLFISVGRDVTKQVHAEEALKERNQVLQDMGFELRDALEQSRIAQRTQSAFLANVSHELRTPLNAIVGFSDIIQQTDVLQRSPEKVMEYTQYIHSAGQHLTSLVNDILDISSLAANESEASRDQISIPAALETCRTLVNHKAQKKQIAIDTAACGEAPDIIFDTRHFKQIFTNLLDNAIKFSPEESTIILAVSKNQSGDLAISVADEGRGIEEAQMDSIFTAFSRADWVRSQEVEGAGLGLALVNEMTSINGCEVSVSSEVGKGAIFAVHVPADRIVKSDNTDEGSSKTAEPDAASHT